MNNIYYTNQSAVRNRNLSPELAQALSFLPELGLTMEVFSGGQPGIHEGGPRVGSTRHDHGHAADVFFYKDGRKLDWANPDDLPYFTDIVKRGRAAGLTGFGAGPDYMRPGSMHLGFGKEAVWGAGGKGANAPEWLRSAYYGTPAPTAPSQPRTGQHNTDPNYAGVDLMDGESFIQSILGQTLGTQQPARPPQMTAPQMQAQVLTNALAPRTQQQDPRNFLNKMTFGA